MTTTVEKRFDIVPLIIPESLNDESRQDVRRFIEATDMLNQLSLALWRHEDHCKSARERLVSWRPNEHRDQKRFLGLEEGRVVAVGEAVMPLSDNLSLAYVRVDVAHAARSAGLATAMLTQLESVATEGGRTILLAGTEIPDRKKTGEIVSPANGEGAVPACDAGTRFALARGYGLDLVERMSVAPLPAQQGVIEAGLNSAREIAGDAYELLTWADICPEEALENYARLKTQISADQPLGDLEMTPEQWNGSRVRAAELQLLSQRGHSITVAVRHRLSNELVGHSVIEIFDGKPEAAWQDDTLVLPLHRGSRLGMLMKVANLKSVAQMYPEARRLYTWNATENTHMLAINDALGFEPSGITGIWQKNLT